LHSVAAGTNGRRSDGDIPWKPRKRDTNAK